MQANHQPSAVIVAHPDDEVLWCGGLLLETENWHWTVATLCRASDQDRSPRFGEAMTALGTRGVMADLDDGPEQKPLPTTTLMETIRELLPPTRFRLLLTHGPCGEYTRHRRHEECCRAVLALWQTGNIQADELWLFAYDDAGGDHLPRADLEADRRFDLSPSVWLEKRRLLTEIYGFAQDSWEVRTTPKIEAFHSFRYPEKAAQFIATRKADR